MATYHGVTGQPLDRDDTPHGNDTETNIPHDYHNEDTGDIETIGQEPSHQPGKPYSGTR